MKFKSPIEVQAGISDGDPTNPLGQSGYLLSSDGSNVNWISPGGLSAETAEAIVQPIKANEALSKGDPVYIVGFQNGQNTNIVAKADSSDVAKMPVVGLVDDDYASQAFGTMTAFGSFNGAFDTTGGTENWAVGDIIFVKPGGGLTNIKPGGTDLIQNVAIVSRVQQNTGELEVIALGRTNDVPNLPAGRLFVGTAGVTSLLSDVVYIDDTNDRVGIGTTNPSKKLDVNGRVRIGDINYTYGGNNYHVLLAEDSNDAYISNINGNATISGGGYYYGSNLRLLNSTSTSYSGIQAKADGAITFENATGGTAGSTIAVSEKMRINSTGDVGIGTIDPKQLLHIASTSAQSVITLQRTNSNTTGAIGALQWTAIDNHTVASMVALGDGNDEGAHITFNTTSAASSDNPYGISERMRINSSGNVGIGTTSPSEKLEVVGNVVLDNSNAKLKIKAGATGTVGSIDFTFNTDSTQYGLIDLNYNSRASQGFRIKSLYPMTLDAVTAQKFLISGGEKMRINSSGSVGIGTTSPSARLNVSGGDVTVDNTSTVYLRLNATNTSNPSVIIQAEQSGATSPPMGQLIWGRNPGLFGVQLSYYNGTILNALKLDGSNFIVTNNGSERMRINSSGNVGIGTTNPNAKLDVNGGVRIANDTSAASASNVGTLKYYTSGNNSYVDMCMQTGASTYAWVNIVTNSW